jgi:hypothetical protein
MRRLVLLSVGVGLVVFVVFAMILTATLGGEWWALSALAGGACALTFFAFARD